MLCRLVSAAALAAILASAATTSAADLHVDDGNETGKVDGSAERPFTSIQAAVDAAEAGDTIRVAAGTYAQKLVVEADVTLLGGYAGGSEADYAASTPGDFVTRDPLAFVTTIQGKSGGAAVELLYADAVVDGFYITGGKHGVYAIGDYIAFSSPVVSNNVIEKNGKAPATDQDQGGGVYAIDASVQILGNVIRQNVAGRGGAVSLVGGHPVVDGNLVEDNTGMSDHGGGIYAAGEQIVIAHNVVRGNVVGAGVGYGWGGGILVYGNGTTATIHSNLVTDNVAPSVGSGIFVDDGAEVLIHHVLIHGNACTTSGGAGIYVDGYGDLGSKVTLESSTIADHDCGQGAGNGVFVEHASTVELHDCIVWGNGGDDFFAAPGTSIAASYTDSEEDIGGTGNLHVDPLFADPAAGDFHLRSKAGRWDPAAAGGKGGWVADAVSSPCIDAGDPASDVSAEPPPNGGRIEMGAYGGTSQASLSGDEPVGGGGQGGGAGGDGGAAGSGGAGGEGASGGGGGSAGAGGDGGAGASTGGAPGSGGSGSGASGGGASSGGDDGAATAKASDGAADDGGCAMSPAGPAEPLSPLAAALALLTLVRRRASRAVRPLMQRRGARVKERYRKARA